MLTPKVSVIMAIYNTKEDWLRKAIESILNQTYKDFEFIIINDGSTNNTEEVIKSYSDKRIRYIYQENQGAAASRNNGIKQATGEYIAIMDSDDISLPNRLEKEVEFLDKNNDYFIVGSWAEVFPKKRYLKTIEEPRILDLFKECSFVHSTVMFRRNKFIEKDYSYKEDWSLAEDYYLWCQILKAEKAHNLQEVLVKYRLDGQGISSNRKEIAERNTIYVQQEILDYITSNKKIQNRITDTLFRDETITNKFTEKIFSITNFRQFNKKYKVITILGLEIRLLTKEYKID